MNNSLNVWSNLDHHGDSPNRESGQYRGNEMPCWRSGLSECSCNYIIKLLLQINNNIMLGITYVNMFHS